MGLNPLWSFFFFLYLDLDTGIPTRRLHTLKFHLLVDPSMPAEPWALGKNPSPRDLLITSFRATALALP